MSSKEQEEDKNYHSCWLGYRKIKDQALLNHYRERLKQIATTGRSPLIDTACEELSRGITEITGQKPRMVSQSKEDVDKAALIIARSSSTAEGLKHLFYNKDKLKNELKQINEEGYLIINNKEGHTLLTGQTDRGILYGAFHLLRLLQLKKDIRGIRILNNPRNTLRMINHWDNLDGSIERGYAGKSIFYKNNRLTENRERIRDYARLLASIGINSIAINNVNVHQQETYLITDKLEMVKKLADIFRNYGIRVYLSINFASTIEPGGLPTADPLDKRVREWWKETTAGIYKEIPDFGGFLVKADSEYRPGPFSYNRSHAEGANMLAEALKPFGGLLIWRCFVYNCQQDWRDYQTDRARAAYDNFKPLDGDFNDNVILQIKNGPMDFQVREPVSPLFGGLEESNQLLELQITQEYTGQQKDLCYLIPQWKEVLDFDTYARGEGSTVKKVLDGSLFNRKHNGITGVVNVGDDYNWTGHYLAQANLYGFGRLSWDPELSQEEITDEWTRLTFGHQPEVVETISRILLKSWSVYEKYTVPLGIGWMVNPGHHYGPNVDGYEYSLWGTYHRADHYGIGVDRSVKTGTGFAGQYYPENANKFETPESCPEELLLFFHHIPYTYKLKSGKTLIQHIYDTHFEGVEQVIKMKEEWKELKGRIAKSEYQAVLSGFEKQLKNAREWRDVVNTYFFRKSAIDDQQHRKIYK